jgi:hypothetical protein
MRLSQPIQLEKSVRSQLVMRTVQTQQCRMSLRWGLVVAAARGCERAQQQAQRGPHLATAHRQA